MRQKVKENLLYATIFSAIVAAARFRLDFALVTFFLGTLVGAVILLTDYLFQVFLVQPELELSKEAKKMVKEGNYLQAVKLVYQRRSEIKYLTFHTIFFQVIFYIFGFFVITSSSSAFGKGMVLMALLHLLKEQINELRVQKELSRVWFQRINVNLNIKEQKIYVAIVVVIFLIYTFIYI